jgi:hypothetical protein
MTTTKRSTFGAGLRTTILLATLSGLFVATDQGGGAFTADCMIKNQFQQN